MRKLGSKTGGMVALSGKIFTCKVGDSIEEIKKQNPLLTDVELKIVFDITREQTDEDYEQDLTTED